MLSISGLAAAGGVGVETIRFYQRKGLVRAPGPADKARGIRHYDDADVKRLRFIRTAQAAGFTLAEIAELLTLDAGDDRARVRALARARIERLDEQIAVLRAARASLERLARECAAGDAGPCPILKAFETP